MKKILITMLSFVSILVLVSATVYAQNQTPKPPYEPPHPYPEPIDPNAGGTRDDMVFPLPGNAVKYYLDGKTVEDILDEVGYDFRSETWRNQMIALRDQADSAANQGSPYAEQVFPQLKQDALDKMAALRTKLEQKRERLINSDALNDQIQTDIRQEYWQDSASPSSKDGQIKAEINMFFSTLLTQLSVYEKQVQAARTASELKNILDSAQQWIHDADRQSSIRTLAARVVGQRVLYFSYLVEQVLNWVVCLVNVNGPFAAAGFSVDKHQKYLVEPQSLGQQDWKSETPIGLDLTNTYPYRNGTHGVNWPNNSLGARAEYKLVATRLENDCVGGNDECKAYVREHMRNGKYLVQDMFHLAWWGYDNFLLQIENNPNLSLSNVNVLACPMPKIRWMRQSSSAPEGFGKFLTPTTTPGSNSRRNPGTNPRVQGSR